MGAAAILYQANGARLQRLRIRMKVAIDKMATMKATTKPTTNWARSLEVR